MYPLYRSYRVFCRAIVQVIQTTVSCAGLYRLHVMPHILLSVIKLAEDAAHFWGTHRFSSLDDAISLIPIGPRPSLLAVHMIGSLYKYDELCMMAYYYRLNLIAEKFTANKQQLYGKGLTNVKYLNPEMGSNFAQPAILYVLCFPIFLHVPYFWAVDTYCVKPTSDSGRTLQTDLCKWNIQF